MQFSTPYASDSPSPSTPTAPRQAYHSTTAFNEAEELLRSAMQPSLERIRRDRDRVSSRLRPLLEYIEQHLFDRRLNVQHLKQACGIRDNSIAILFHSQVGHSPKSYISERRLETASRLLRDTDIRVWRISEMVGYSGLGVFSKAFNRWAKQRPNAFRRQARDLACSQPPGPLPNDELMDRALAGSLSHQEASRLLQRLLEIYPRLTERLPAELGDSANFRKEEGLAADS